ncbi:protein-L-isoaspartate(D-aspartate) O-methyltransferase [Methanobrevibacter sp. TMH8]|uniref:protein-L-isoaspartate(D-aspartate) O-methyltransferase n=1 Tax=Methanobrevibacter sp. TMH8 TaxID=2848611 RepID=UPI001CCC829D|nr:protein-L-isoaspartate(D-aspartate) O-methyltransferase [Methanobrevibacter sp. TMH8]
MKDENKMNSLNYSENEKNFTDKREKLVNILSENGFIKTKEVKRAIGTVPREEFIPEENRAYAYLDRPIRLIEGQTISAPHMVAIICEILQFEEGMNVLEIGTGFGYNAAAVSEMMNKKTHVYTIERIGSLAKIAKENLKKTGYDEVIDIILGDGTLGYETKAPYDRIYGTASAPYISEPLKKQLKVGGKLLMPVGKYPEPQDLILLTKESENKYKEDYLGKVDFVPMIGKYGHDE